MQVINYIKKCKIVIFDFDGVILDSSRMKSKIFKEILQAFPLYFDKAWDYHIVSKGTPISIQIEYIVNNIIKYKNAPNLINELVSKYKELTLSRLLTVQEIPFSMQCIKQFNKTSLLFVVSNAPKDELLYSIKKRDLTGYFSEVYSGHLSNSKAFYINKISMESKVSLDRILFIGDTRKDQIEAQKSGCKFIGLNNELSKIHNDYGLCVGSLDELLYY